jgi:signal transduction histidine kinase
VERALGRARAAAGDEAGAMLDEAAEELGRTRAELAELGGGLPPAALSERGLGPALAALARQSPVPVDVDASPEHLPPDIEAAIYFVCSEALANVAKHARASRAALAVSVDDGWARVRVSDDGRGGADAERGSGLLGLVDRVEVLGGKLRLDSPVGGGTRLIAEVPTCSGVSLNLSASQEKS